MLTKGTQCDILTVIKTNSFVDNEEQNLIKSLETDGWKPVKDIVSWKTLLSETAVNTLIKNNKGNQPPGNSRCHLQ